MSGRYIICRGYTVNLWQKQYENIPDSFLSSYKQPIEAASEIVLTLVKMPERILK